MMRWSKWRDDSEDRDPIDSSDADYDNYAEDDYEDVCDGDHGPDHPCYGISLADAQRIRHTLQVMTLVSYVVLLVGCYLIWTALWGTATGFAVALLLLAGFVTVWKFLKRRAFDRFYWSEGDPNVDLEFLIAMEGP